MQKEEGSQMLKSGFRGNIVLENVDFKYDSRN